MYYANMHFVHRSTQLGESIAAIATAPGEGGVAIIRISGETAFAIADALFDGPVSSFASHHAHYGAILDDRGTVVDRVLLLPMRAPRSYTGEDTVEIHCHGGSLLTRKILELTIDAGARLAEAGEFTQRAYLNGKLDLAQAEAVQELIAARNTLALTAASSQLEGTLSVHIRTLQDRLTHVAAILEAWVDFPEEGLEFASREELTTELKSIQNSMEHLSATFHDGKLLREGLTLCLAGRPNVGKSSLMNQLLTRDRAIVTPIAGTTRDLLEDELTLGGLNLRLIDTAGIRDSEELIEKEGIRRSRRAMEEADLILLLLDLTQGLTPTDQELIEQLNGRAAVVIWNKVDLPHAPPPQISWPHVVTLSAQQGIGIDTLKKSIDTAIWQDGPPEHGEVLVTKLRHKEALDRAISYCLNLVEGLTQDHSPEFLAADVRQCLIELGQIIGSDITEDILSEIFSTFCVGK